MATTTSFFMTLVLAAALAGIPLSLAVNPDPFTYPPLEQGLSFGFYKSTCAQLEPIVRNYLKDAFRTDIGLAAGLLRLHFHDCFVQVWKISCM